MCIVLNVSWTKSTEIGHSNDTIEWSSDTHSDKTDLKLFRTLFELQTKLSEVHKHGAFINDFCDVNVKMHNYILLHILHSWRSGSSAERHSGDRFHTSPRYRSAPAPRPPIRQFGTHWSLHVTSLARYVEYLSYMRRFTRTDFNMARSCSGFIWQWIRPPNGSWEVLRFSAFLTTRSSSPARAPAPRQKYIRG